MMSLTNITSISHNLLQSNEHLLVKKYVDTVLRETSEARNNREYDFTENKLTNIGSLSVSYNPTDQGNVTKKDIDDYFKTKTYRKHYCYR